MNAQTLIMLMGLPAVGISLILLPIYFLSWRSAPEPKKPLSGLPYTFISLGVGALAFAAGAAAGIWMACSSEASGNLCGLVGIFGLGPLLAGLAISGCAYLMTRNAKQA